MNILATLLSQTALQELKDRIEALDAPGGVLGIYDDQTGSVIVVGVDRRTATPRLAGWSIHGPCSLEAAVQLLRKELAVAEDFPCQFH